MNSITVPEIIVDFREKPSGIPDLLLQRGLQVNFSQLKAGDYILNNEIIVERKSADDFILSIISGRLFAQCARIRNSHFRPFLLLEGNPKETGHNIDQRAVIGAIISVMASWQIPVINAVNHDESATMLFILGTQTLRSINILRLIGNKPKKLKSHRLRFLQGLPDIGPVIANRLYEHFGSIQAIINANDRELGLIEGIGKNKAKKILEFVSVM